MPKVIEFPVDRISKGVHHFTPEMGQRKISCQMEVTIGHYGNYYIKTPLELSGQGIKFIKKYTADEFLNGRSNRLYGWNNYRVTDRALNKLKEQYSISMESNLD
jgi:RNA binding exosome subunit